MARPRGFGRDRGAATQADPREICRGAATKSSDKRSGRSPEGVLQRAGKRVCALLKDARRIHGGLPLVIASDNGSENRNADVEQLLGCHHIIALSSEPQTARHNPWSKRGIRELKADAELESGTPVSGIAEVLLRLAEAWWRTDHERWRPTRAEPPSSGKP